jgi:integrase
MQPASRAKRGRKAKDHVYSWDGQTINGLYRKNEKVWRVRATGREFTEPDERLAVARFLQMTAVEPVAFPVREAPPGVPQDLTPASARFDEARGKWVTLVEKQAVCDLFREWLIRDRHEMARLCGIPQLAWIEDLKRPDAPTMRTLIDTYAAKPRISTNELNRVKSFWKEFCSVVKIQSLDELTHEHVEAYERYVHRECELAPKSIKHRYGRIRTVVRYGLKRGKGASYCREALDKLAMLEMADGDPLDPKPIDGADFRRILLDVEKAKDHTFKAIMLLALNAALYSSEVAAIRWQDVDLKRCEFVSHRNKTKVPRIAVLWPETVAAIESLPRQGDYLFYTTRRSYTTFSVLERWRAYRQAAGLDHLTFSQIRDAAFTIACSISTDQARMLAGHRVPGSADNYLKRHAKAVAEVCRAIHGEILGPSN